jgi:hypothetical protein
MNAVVWDQWRERVERQDAGGLSVAEFCRREGIATHAFYVWKRKLRQKAAGRGEAGQAGGSRGGRRRSAAAGPSRPSGRPPAGSARGVKSAGFLQLPIAAIGPGAQIEVALCDGTVVRLASLDRRALVAVLRVLRGQQGERSCGEGRHA